MGMKRHLRAVHGGDGAAVWGCRIVWRCWQNRLPYDPARHRALQRHITVIIPTVSGPMVDHAATRRIAAGTFATNAENENPKDGMSQEARDPALKVVGTLASNGTRRRAR